MIYTCTLNPAIDYRLVVDDFHLGELNRSKKATFFTGGKGINVSIVLNNLGTENIATGFIGGFTGMYLKQYLTDTLKLNTNFIEVNGFSRINVKLLTGEKETEVNQEGPKIEENDFLKFMDVLHSLKEKDILICGGSPVKGIDSIYQKIAIECASRKIEFVMDITCQDLKDVLPYHPLLVKPNLHELQEFFHAQFKGLDEIIKHARKLVILGAKNVIVSLGGRGSIFVNDLVTYWAKALVGEVKNTVGAGDSMVAGFTSSYNVDHDILKAYRFAVASGSATAFSETLGTKSEIEYYFDEVEIEEIK